MHTLIFNYILAEYFFSKRKIKTIIYKFIDWRI